MSLLCFRHQHAIRSLKQETRTRPCKCGLLSKQALGIDNFLRYAEIWSTCLSTNTYLDHGWVRHTRALRMRVLLLYGCHWSSKKHTVRGRVGTFAQHLQSGFISESRHKLCARVPQSRSICVHLTTNSRRRDRCKQGQLQLAEAVI